MSRYGKIRTQLDITPKYNPAGRQSRQGTLVSDKEWSESGFSDIVLRLHDIIGT